MGNIKFSLKNKDFLHGIVVKAKEGINKNPQFTLPKIPDDCLLIFPKDITGSNIIEIQKQNIPLFASSYITYIGQPLYAIFAPTLEKAEQISSSIIIEYKEREKENIKSQEDINFTYKKGGFDSTFKEIQERNNTTLEEDKKYKSFNSKITFDRINSTTYNTTKIIVDLDNDILNVHTPTQWPSLIINNISNICGYNKKKIIIHKEKAYSLKDELLIQPAILTSIAALAAIKTKKVIYLHDNISNSRPKIEIEKQTWIEKENKRTIIEKIDVNIYQGSTSIFHKEMCNQLIAGLIPYYNLKAILINFTFLHTSLAPANFYGGLGYENALAATQIHTTKLGNFLQLSPFLWINKSFYESSIHKKVLDIDNIQTPKENLSNLVDESFYNRKYAAYKVNSAIDRNFSTFTPYARGIGLAIGPSISGFSSNNENFSSPKVKLTLNFDGKVEINTSFYNSSKTSELWKDIIYKELDVDKNNVTFCTNSLELIDSGPCTLSANSKIMSEQIRLACDKINEKRFLEGLPISVSLGKTKKTTKAPLFKSDTWVAIVMEVSIDPITLEPIVFSVNINCSVGNLVNEKSYKTNMKVEILNTLDELGAKIAKGNKFQLTIKLNQNTDKISDSITSGLRGVIYAAFNTAIEMALNTDNTILPITSDIILEKMEKSND
ncbi:MAG: hypothetical protein ACPKM0_09345 [Pleomorphochaeta sp.]